MSSVFCLLSLAAGAATVTALIMWVLLRTGYARRMAVDVPNHRSLHARATPRIGGWALIPVVVAGLLIWARPLWPVAWATLGLALISYLDDWRGLSARLRFIAHVLAASLLLLIYPPPAKWGGMVMVFFLTGCINAYNFMDGADGLAGGMTLFGFSAYTAAAYSTAPDLAISAALIAGAAGGFLFFNWPPARAFLGDAGAIPLGFLAGALGYIGSMRGIWECAFPLTVFAPFILDASMTLCRRLLRGEQFWQAHREHYYQRMIQMSTGHTATVRIWHVAILLGAGLALAGLRISAQAQWIILGLWSGALFMCGLSIDRRWHFWTQRIAVRKNNI